MSLPLPATHVEDGEEWETGRRWWWWWWGQGGWEGREPPCRPYAPCLPCPLPCPHLPCLLWDLTTYHLPCAHSPPSPAMPSALPRSVYSWCFLVFFLPVHVSFGRKEGTCSLSAIYYLCLACYARITFPMPFCLWFPVLPCLLLPHMTSTPLPYHHKQLPTPLPVAIELSLNLPACVPPCLYLPYPFSGRVPIFLPIAMLIPACMCHLYPPCCIVTPFCTLHLAFFCMYFQDSNTWDIPFLYHALPYLTCSRLHCLPSACLPNSHACYPTLPCAHCHLPLLLPAALCPFVPVFLCPHTLVLLLPPVL